MVRVLGKAVGKLKEKRAQILLPAVMLVPIFILVIYLLFETAKVSMSKGIFYRININLIDPILLKDSMNFVGLNILNGFNKDIV